MPALSLTLVRLYFTMYVVPTYQVKAVPAPAPPPRTLLYRVEVFSDAGEHFLSCTWKENSEYYFALTDPRHFDLYSLRGNYLPRQCLFAVPPADLQVAQPDVLRSSGVFVKRLPIILHSEQIDVRRMRPLNEELIAEARIYLMLQSGGKHANICAYYGMVVKDGYLEGLALERCNTTLLDFINSRTPYDKSFITKVMAGLRSALDYLHSLGYAHVCLPLTLACAPIAETGAERCESRQRRT
jgi:serine/threonine protein kinase